MNAGDGLGNLRSVEWVSFLLPDGTIGKFLARPRRPDTATARKPTKGSLCGPNFGRKDVRLTGHSKRDRQACPQETEHAAQRVKFRLHLPQP